MAPESYTMGNRSGSSALRKQLHQGAGNLSGVPAQATLPPGAAVQQQWPPNAGDVSMSPDATIKVRGQRLPEAS